MYSNVLQQFFLQQKTTPAQSYLSGLERGEKIKQGRLRSQLLQEEAKKKEYIEALRRRAGNDPQAMQQLAAFDPSAAKAVAELQVNNSIIAGQAAQALKMTPLEARPRIYKQTIQSLQQRGLDVSNLPAEYDPELVDPLLDNVIASSREIQDVFKKQSDAPSAVREFEYFQTLNPQQQQQYLNVKRNVLQTGLQMTPEGEVTTFAGLPESKAEIKAAEKSAEVISKERAETLQNLESRKSKLPELEETVAELRSLAPIATFTKAGLARDASRRQLGLPETEGAIARAKYIAIIDNQILPLLRDTFGAQFTEREGDTLRKTLGDPDKSPAEKMAVLDSFIKQKKKTVESLERRLKKKTNTPSNNQQPSGQVGGINWRLK